MNFQIYLKISVYAIRALVGALVAATAELFVKEYGNVAICLSSACDNRPNFRRNKRNVNTDF